jgi:hypothetical protein
MNKKLIGLVLMGVFMVIMGFKTQPDPSYDANGGGGG